MENPTDDNRLLNSIVQEVISEAHIDPSLILPEEIDYIREHVLKKPLGVVHIWALGVGVVIAGMYFGWNFGLPVAGPVGNCASTSCAAGRSWRRRSNHPGSGSIVRPGVSFFSRSNMSMYLRSITGQS